MLAGIEIGETFRAVREFNERVFLNREQNVLLQLMIARAIAKGYFEIVFRSEESLSIDNLTKFEILEIDLDQ